MNILVMNFGIGGFAGDASQFLLLIKGLKKTYDWYSDHYLSNN